MSNTGLFYHESVPTTVRIAQAIGITATGFLAGHAATASFQLAPAIMEAPAPLLARQWKKAWSISAVTGPALSLVTGLTFGYLASREPPSSSAFKCYTAAALLVPSTIPYSILVLKQTTDKLLAKADSLAATEITDKAAEAGVAREETVHGLVDKWALINLGNALLTAIGAFSAAWATVDKIDVVRFKDLGLTGGANRLG